MNFKGPDTMHGKSFHTMDTASLRALLMMELSADGELDVARIQEITDILAEREQITVMDADAAWNDFQQNYISSEPIHTLEQDCTETAKPVFKRKAWKRGALVAAVLSALLLGASLTAQAASFDIWKAMAKWTSETFGFTFGGEESVPTEQGIMLENEELKPLWDALIEDGILKPCLPTYLPDGFEQSELTTNSKSGYWCAMYQSGSDLIQIQILRLQGENWSALQKDDVDPDIYVWDGQEFFIMTNMGQSVVTWTSGNYEYYISGASESEIYSMIKSIHKEET